MESRPPNQANPATANLPHLHTEHAAASSPHDAECVSRHATSHDGFLSAMAAVCLLDVCALGTYNWKFLYSARNWIEG